MVAQALILAQEAEFKIGLVHSEVQASQGYTVSLSKKKKKTKRKKNRLFCFYIICFYIILNTVSIYSFIFALYILFSRLQILSN